MRWLVLIILLTPSISYGVNINNPEAISDAIVDPDSFSFFYIGHAYGAHNGKGGEKQLAYPHPEILKVIDQLVNYHFGAFGGDVIEICNTQTIKAFEDFLVIPLGLPLINSMGNHDRCLDKIYGFPALQAFSKGNNSFLIINTNNRNFDNQQIEWLGKQLNIFNLDPKAKRIFIFSHRPTFMLLDPSLNAASGLANYPVEKNHFFTHKIGKTLSEIDARKEVYWFAGDVGMRLSLIYKQLKPNIHFIASGLYERDEDHYLDIKVTSGKVNISAINFLSGDSSNLNIDNNSESKEMVLRPTKAFDDGWSATMLTKLYTSVGVGEARPIIPDHVEGDTKKMFNMSYHADTNTMVLTKEKCATSAENIFYVQFYPVHKQDRKHNTFLWNGYHFYASKVGSASNDECVAVVPLPEYAYKYLMTGQLTSAREQIWQAKVNYTSIPVTQ